jgi:hypothetical protein
MSAASITTAGQLTAALATERDPWHRTLSLISAVELMAEAFHGHDEHCALINFASELRGQLFQNAQAVLDRNEDEAEADRYGGFVDTLHLWDESERKRHENLVRMRCIKPSQYQPIESKVLA